MIIIFLLASAAGTLVLITSAIQGTATFNNSSYFPSSCYNNSDALRNKGSECGKIYSVRCTGSANLSVPRPCKNNGPVTVTIVDYCPKGCRGTIDLSREAFSMIANPDAGKIKIEYAEFMSDAPGKLPPYGKEIKKERNDIKGLVVGLTVGACALILCLGVILFISRRKKRIKGNKLDDHHASKNVIFGDEFRDGMAPRKFSLVELAKMTSNFKGQKLGEGGFGAVYKGYLKDLNTYVGVKRISKTSKQGIMEFKSEVKIISRLRHKNLIKLVGWCQEKRELLLVYEFMANGSLDSHLFKGKSLLTWEVRYKIVQGLASALSYYHEDGDHCVLHRDIKTSNIMLDSDFNAKLGDFGLARLVDHAKGSQTTRLAGTMGYMAPECVSTGKFNKESDVYSFGIVALEIACGRRSIEPKYEESLASLVVWVWDSFGNQRQLDVADQKLCLAFDAKQMECLLMVGLWCAHPDPNQRPSIRQANQVLNFESPLPELPGTRPPPTYGDVTNIAFGIKASEPCYSTLGVPR